MTTAIHAVETPLYQLSICGDCWTSVIASPHKVPAAIVDELLDRLSPVPCNTTGDWEQDTFANYLELQEEFAGAVPEDVSEWSGVSVVGSDVTIPGLEDAFLKFLELSVDLQEQMLQTCIDADHKITALLESL